MGLQKKKEAKQLKKAKQKANKLLSFHLFDHHSHDHSPAEKKKHSAKESAKDLFKVSALHVPHGPHLRKMDHARPTKMKAKASKSSHMHSVLSGLLKASKNAHK